MILDGIIGKGYGNCFSSKYGVCCGAFLAGAFFFFFFAGPGSKRSYFVFFRKWKRRALKFGADLSNCHAVMFVLDPFGDQKRFQDLRTISSIIDNSQPTSSEHLLLKCRWSGKCANHYKSMKIATYLFRILLLTGTYFIRVVCICIYIHLFW